MAIRKIPQTYLDNNASYTPLNLIGEKLNETIDVVNEATDGAETMATLTATSSVITDTISEYTAAAGVTIDGVLLKDSTVKTDTIIEKTAATGVTIDGTLLKDAGITATGVSTFSDATGVTTDTITERTAAAGVTVDGVLLKDSSIVLADGLVSNLAIKIGADTNNGIYGVSDTQLGIAVEGTLVGGFNTTGLFTDVISEQTSTVGVTVDGVLLKDGGVSANSMFAGFYPIAAEQALSGPGAINITAYHTKFTSTGTGDALTLAAGSQIGQMKKISYVAEGAGGDTGVLTLTGYTSITYNAITDYTILMWNGSAWFVIESVGVTIV